MLFTDTQVTERDSERPLFSRAEALVKKGRLPAAAGLYGRALDYERALPAGAGAGSWYRRATARGSGSGTKRLSG